MKTKLHRTNIEFVVETHLCTCCGTCVGACPQSCISMTINDFGIYVPLVDNNRCNGCGVCIQVCPGHEFDYQKYQKQIHGEIPNDVVLGSLIHGYSCHATNEEILSISQSGGFVSALLIYCLEAGIIDGASVTKWKENSPFEPVTYIAKDRKSILAAVGSKYNPVPAAQILRELLSANGRFAFVGTPCQIQGMRKAERIFPKLADKIVLYIGLHCFGVYTYHYQKQILHKLRLRKKDVTYFHYRDKASQGWPGDMRLKDTEGKIYDLNSKISRIWPRFYFTCWRCFLCFDKANEFSDISCGDCRIPYIYDEFGKKGFDIKQGLSVIVVRTKRGDHILEEAIKNGWLQVLMTDTQYIAASLGVSGKKIGIKTFSKISNIFGLGIPDYGVLFSMRNLESSWAWELLKPLNVLFSSQYYLSYSLSRKAFFRYILRRLPHIFMGVFSAMRYIFCDWARFGKHPFLSRCFSKINKSQNLMDS